MIIPAISSIIVIYGAVFAFNKLSGRNYCPICAGVSLTWMWLLALYFLGYHEETVLVGILMGGSVVGIMYKLKNSIMSHLFAVIAFLAVYLLLTKNWLYFTIALLLTAAIALGASRPRADRPRDAKNVSKIEEELKDCCH